MVAGSRLNMARIVSSLDAKFRWAMGMIQLAEKSLSRPRGPVCCCSAMEAWPWSISIQSRCICMSIGGAVEFGSRLVPEVVWRRTFSVRVLVGPPMFMFPIFIVVMFIDWLMLSLGLSADGVLDCERIGVATIKAA